MESSKLSKVLKCDGLCFETDMSIIYDQFYEGFLKKEIRPTYNEKFVFFNMNKELSINNNGFVITKTLLKPERFLHIVSLGNSEKYTSDPCYNDNSSLLCKNECNINKALEDFRVLNRTECYYRLSRIHRIPEVIELANNKDGSIQEWTEIEKNKVKDKNGKYRITNVYKRFIRYKHRMDDYIVILKEDRKSGEIYKYDFITSFPLFNKVNKREYDNKYASFLVKKEH